MAEFFKFLGNFTSIDSIYELIPIIAGSIVIIVLGVQKIRQIKNIKKDNIDLAMAAGELINIDKLTQGIQTEAEKVRIIHKALNNKQIRFYINIILAIIGIIVTTRTISELNNTFQSKPTNKEQSSINDNIQENDPNFLQQGINDCKSEKYDSAIKNLKISIQLKEDLGKAYYYLGVSYDSLSFDSTAQKYYDSARHFKYSN